MTARLRLTPAERRAILYAQDCQCSLCGNLIHPFGYFEIDHARALGLGGEDGGDNLVAVHQTCHREKTRTDRKMIAKADSAGKSHAEHEEAMRTRTRRPNKKQRTKQKWDARRVAPLAPRQD